MPDTSCAMELAIRTANPDDAPAIVSLVNAAYRSGDSRTGWTHESRLVDGDRISREQVLALMVPDSCVFVAAQDKQLLACVHLQVENGIAHIGMLATQPDAQVRGLGKAMLAYAERYAIEHYPVYHFEMVVIAERAELVAFYLRRGYQKTGRVKGYPVSAGVGVPKVPGLTIEVLQKPV